MRRGQAVSPEALPHLDAERSWVGREAQQGDGGAESGGVDDTVSGANLIVQDRSRGDSAEENDVLGISSHLVWPTLIRRVQRSRRERTHCKPSIGVCPGVEQPAGVVKAVVQEKPGISELGKCAVDRADRGSRDRGQGANWAGRQIGVGQERERHPVAGAVECQGARSPFRLGLQACHLGVRVSADGLVGLGEQHGAPVQREVSVALIVQEAGACVGEAVDCGVVEAAAHQQGQPSRVFVGRLRVAADGEDLNPMQRRPMA